MGSILNLPVQHAEFFTNAVITGFNTDIDYKGVIYHVQTEDKGLTTPLILSLVFDRGTILASKRSPYDDLLQGGFDKEILIERLKKQHTLICAAVRAGRIEDLKRMTARDYAARHQNLNAPKDVRPPVEKTEEVITTDFKTEEIPIPEILKHNAQILKQSNETVWDGALKIVEEPETEMATEVILPAEAVEIISDYDNFGNLPIDRLKIELVNETIFRGGERKTITIMVRRGNAEMLLPDVQILVKVVGSSFRPLIFHAKTDRSGVASVHLQLPHFKAGRAAILIKAMFNGEETELHRVIQQG